LILLGIGDRSQESAAQTSQNQNTRHDAGSSLDRESETIRV
jgi:hypothetical protein